jgi:guanylate kinase
MNGKCIAIVGPSAAGKTELVKALISKLPHAARLITNTTRTPRTGEVHGKDYYFISDVEFKSKLEKGDLFEHAEVYGNWYGLSTTDLNRTLENNEYVFIIIDSKGARSIKNKLRDKLFTIFIKAGSLEEIKNRIQKIRTDITPKELQKRMDTVVDELATANSFDAVVENREGHFEETVEKVLKLLT